MFISQPDSASEMSSHFDYLVKQANEESIFRIVKMKPYSGISSAESLDKKIKKKIPGKNNGKIAVFDQSYVPFSSYYVCKTVNRKPVAKFYSQDGTFIEAVPCLYGEGFWQAPRLNKLLDGTTKGMIKVPILYIQKTICGNNVKREIQFTDKNNNNLFAIKYDGPVDKTQIIAEIKAGGYSRIINCNFLLSPHVRVIDCT